MSASDPERLSQLLEGKESSITSTEEDDIWRKYIIWNFLFFDNQSGNFYGLWMMQIL